MATRYSNEQLFKLEKDLNEYLLTLPESERDEFADSEYGESLYMICSGIRYEESNKN